MIQARLIGCSCWASVVRHGYEAIAVGDAGKGRCHDIAV